MTVGEVEHRERITAAQALIRWAQSAQVGRSAPVGQLGGFQLTGMVRLDYEHGGREAYLALDGVPVEAAHATVTHLAENPLTLVRQLEHRIADLEGRRARTLVRQQEAAQEIARAREGLARPFKYAGGPAGRCDAARGDHRADAAGRDPRSASVRRHDVGEAGTR